MRLSDDDRRAIAAAVSAAEAGTDGEIVTMIAASSDNYRDTALHYGLLAALFMPAIAAIEPGHIPLISDGWSAPDPRWMILAVMFAEVLVFLAVRFALARDGWRRWLTPRATKRRRVRARAIAMFKAATDQRTAQRVGVLLYLSAGERMAEIVADGAIHAVVPPERWGAAMAALITNVRKGRPADGMVAAIGQIGAIIAEHFPKTAADTNELPDRLIEL